MLSFRGNHCEWFRLKMLNPSSKSFDGSLFKTSSRFQKILEKSSFT